MQRGCTITPGTAHRGRSVWYTILTPPKSAKSTNQGVGASISNHQKRPTCMKIAKNLLFISVTLALIWAPMWRVAYGQTAEPTATEVQAAPATEEAKPEKKVDKKALMKAERKEWKKRLKATEPMSFKKLVEDRENLQKELVETTDKLIISEGKLKEVTQENKNLKDGAAFAQAVASAKEDAGNGTVEQRSHPKVDGVVFKVQIGAFRNKDLSKYLDNNPNFSGDTDSDGKRKYTLGQFKNYWEADNFKKYLRDMGVNDAWVVSYKDGERVPIKDVLEGAVAMK